MGKKKKKRSPIASGSNFSFPFNSACVKICSGNSSSTCKAENLLLICRMQKLQRAISVSFYLNNSGWWKASAGPFWPPKSMASMLSRAMETQSGTQNDVLEESSPQNGAIQEDPQQPNKERPGHVKRKALTKTAGYIMQIINKELVEDAKSERPIPGLRAGDVVQLKLETPENKRRVSTFRAIVMGIHRCGYSSTFRIRRYVAEVGVELVLPLYSPNIKELKVLDHRKVRRNKLYYLREKVADKTTKIT